MMEEKTSADLRMDPVVKRWIEHQRRTYQRQTWACVFCPERRIFVSDAKLWDHALRAHHDKLPTEASGLAVFKISYIAESLNKRPTSKDQRRPDDEPILSAQANSQQPTLPTKVAKDEEKYGRHGPLNTPVKSPPTKSLTGLAAYLETPRRSSELEEMRGTSDDEVGASDQPRKRASVGDGISAGSASPYHERLSPSLPLLLSPHPRRSKGRPTPGTYELPLDTDSQPQEGFDSQRPSIRGKRQLWRFPDDDPPLTSSYVDPSNIASVQAQKSRTQQLQYKSQKPSQYEVKGQLQTEEESDKQSPGRSKLIPKLDRLVTTGDGGRYVCNWGFCTEEVRAFISRAEWNEHMDKHHRPYKCTTDGCEKLLGFRCSSDLLRHQRAVHKMHSGPRTNWRDWAPSFRSPPDSSDNVSANPHQIQSSLPDRKPRENRRKILRIRIRDKEHQACPDSGSEKNIMEESFAIKHDFNIRRRLKDLKQFELGNGKYVRSVGRVCVPFELPGSTKAFGQKKRWFHVLPHCPVPLILGMKFLKEAEILTKNRHMLESCPPDLGNISSLLWVGSPRQRMKCSLDGQDLLAVADTGSDLNLMSLKCAKRGGFHIDRRRECRQRVRVGDGSEAETIGQVYVSNLGLDWRSPETHSPESPGLSNLSLGPSDPNLSTSTASISANTESESFGAVFHVLPGLPCDVIFGRDLLEITNAFSLCPELSEAQRLDNDNPFELNVLISLGPISLALPIPRRKRRAAVVESARERHDNERHAEMYRRSQKDDEIALLPVHEQEGAKTLERRRALAWDKLHINCVHCCQA